MKIRKVLIANRGEIAVRVIRTLRSLGIQSIAVYSDADQGALHARLADEAVRIGPAPASESYLRADAIIAAALELEADAIHPGYGFLSERADFARSVEEAGLAFVGPTPSNIARLGDKLASRGALRAAGVPPVPGTDGPVPREAVARSAREVGFPLLLKAAAGGGGKGIRIVRSPEELEGAFDAAASEARNSFGSSDLIAERYLEKARHVEVQVLGDGEGGVRLFHERDCSTQRRLQKVLEETPSPAVRPEARERLLLAAGSAMAEERYRGAGTLEFLLSEDGDLHFLEMNTRLQVEHPVTEMTSGVDLVAEQVAIAEGKRLPRWRARLEESVTESRGAAVEFRVNAEDPLDEFLPSTGRIAALRLPAGPWVRVDSALEPGSVVPPYYDSLIAKVIAWGPDRNAALDRLRVALDEMRVTGVVTTLPLGIALVDDPGFRGARNHCQYLAERLADGRFFPGTVTEEELPLVAAAAAWVRRESSRAAVLAAEGPGGREALSPWVLVERLRLTSESAARGDDGP